MIYSEQSALWLHSDPPIHSPKSARSCIFVLFPRSWVPTKVLSLRLPSFLDMSACQCSWWTSNGQGQELRLQLMIWYLKVCSGLISKQRNGNIGRQGLCLMEETDREISNFTHLFEHELWWKFSETRLPRKLKISTVVWRTTGSTRRGREHVRLNAAGQFGPFFSVARMWDLTTCWSAILGGISTEYPRAKTRNAQSIQWAQCSRDPHGLSIKEIIVLVAKWHRGSWVACWAVEG